MDGDLAPLAGIVELARRYRARIVVDEAHATGVVGPGGRGLVAALGLEREVDVVIGTLSKALGSYGAFVCCTRDVAEFLINRARTLIYSTGLPPASVGAARVALQILQAEPERVAHLHRNARMLRKALSDGGFSVPVCTMPIVPLVVGDPRRAMCVVRDGSATRRVRAGDPPAHRSGRHVAAAPSSDGHPHRRRSETRSTHAHFGCRQSVTAEPHTLSAEPCSIVVYVPRNDSASGLVSRPSALSPVMGSARSRLTARENLPNSGGRYS